MVSELPSRMQRFGVILWLKQSHGHALGAALAKEILRGGSFVLKVAFGRLPSSRGRHREDICFGGEILAREVS